MIVGARRASLRSIRAMRELYRSEMGCQIVHDSWHERGFTRSCVITVDGRVVGYGSVGGVGSDPKDILKEFFLHEMDRDNAEVLFRTLARVSRARWVEAQTNDPFLSPFVARCAVEVDRHTCLFEDGHPTRLVVHNATFRPITESERKSVFHHELEPVGDWVIELDGQIVATGGLMFHYNPSFADIYMEVAGSWRRRGIGAYLVQQLKGVCLDMKRIPAARCSAANVASRRTLERAGMVQCGWIEKGLLVSPQDRDLNTERGLLR